LSQSVNTIAGRNYNVSFWLEPQGGFDKNVAVYMSSACKIDEHFVPLLRTKFFIIFFILYIL
jgi:hypothetical protein